MTINLVPTATYFAPDISESVNFSPGDGPHSTDGKTTQLSEFVINAGGEDRDKPSEASNSALGQLRAKLTSVQDKVNFFLTQRMQSEKRNSTGPQQSDRDLEANLLDDGGEQEEE
ncbi:uncharacterized protein PRCAT00000061001 [Priceomyces carsonii]|uniref:uncharacterized protein n=1 Tax=Priceomyces carsonii TaxID=28549 RepID=UPI002EDABD17|nr:unnamed protein product [Priceomyces carsonii]